MSEGLRARRLWLLAVTLCTLAVGWSIPAWAQADTLEAENMTTTTYTKSTSADSAASGGYGLVMYKNETATAQSTIRGSKRMLIRARGDQCSGAPRMVVKVDGTTVLTQSVASTNWTDYGVNVDLTPNSHRIDISFTNNYATSSTCDRNLRVDRVRFVLAPWTSGFESATFTEWDWWGTGDPHYTGHSVIDPATEGVPYRQGTKVGRFEVTPTTSANGNYHSKLYKNLSYGSGDKPTWSTADISGEYRAWYYLPSGYSSNNDGWMNLFQFKDEYWKDSTKTSGTSDPTWYVTIRSAQKLGVTSINPDAPVAFLQHWQDWLTDTDSAGNPYHDGPRVPVPIGRWFEVKAIVSDNDKIDFYLDGKSLGTALDSHYTVGAGHPYSFNSIFGVGHYGSNVGRLYADGVSFTPR